jgi:hypothetical protein
MQHSAKSELKLFCKYSISAKSKPYTKNTKKPVPLGGLIDEKTKVQISHDTVPLSIFLRQNQLLAGFKNNIC